MGIASFPFAGPSLSPILVADSLPTIVVTESLPLAADGDQTQAPFSPNTMLQTDVVAATVAKTIEAENQVGNCLKLKVYIYIAIMFVATKAIGNT